MTFSLFQLGAQAWLNPQLVARVILGTEYPQLFEWASQVPDAMRAVGVAPNRVSRFEAVTKDLEIVAGDEDSNRAFRARKKLAQLVAGVKGKDKWKMVVQKGGWPKLHRNPRFLSDLSLSLPMFFTEREWKKIVSEFKRRLRKESTEDPSLLFKQMINKMFPNLLPELEKHSNFIFWMLPLVFEGYSRLVAPWHIPEGKPRHPEILGLAIQNGFFFVEAMKFCLNSEYPLKAAKEIEEAILRFKREMPQGNDFNVLTTPERLALYTLFRDVFDLWHDNTSLSYNTVMEHIGRGLALSDAQNLSDILDPNSRFHKLARRSWRVKGHSLDFNFHEVIALAVEIAHYVGFPYASWPHSWSGRVHNALLKSSPYSIQAFVDFLVWHHHTQPNPASSDEFAAAVELLEADIPFDDDCLEEYIRAPNHRQRLEASRLRAKALVGGAMLGEETDLFEVMAVARILGGRIPSLTTLREILGRTKILDRSEGIHFRPFSFSVDLVKPFYDIANKGLLAAYAEEVRNVSTLNGLVKAMQNFTGNREARREIQKYLDELETIPDENQLAKNEYEEELKHALEILEKITKELVSWINLRGPKTTTFGRSFIDGIKETGWLADDLKDWNSDLLDKVVMRAMNANTMIYWTKDDSGQARREVDRYLTRLLIAFARWKLREHPAPFYEEILQFDKDNTSQEETYGVLDRLSEFYYEVGQAWWYFYISETRKPPLPPSVNAIWGRLRTMNQKKSERTGVQVNVTFSPIIGKLGAFYGYLSENCLARPDWAVHAMSDTTFVPYFMSVDGECRGVVQTFTRNISIRGEQKKILIVTGIDPQLRFTPDPGEFLNGLEKGFWEIAREGGYDLVVVPALEFAQSSRRALLRHEFNRYTEKIRIDEPIGFPQVGVHEDGRPIYYYNEAHGEASHSKFLVFRSPK